MPAQGSAVHLPGNLLHRTPCHSQNKRLFLSAFDLRKKHREKRQVSRELGENVSKNWLLRSKQQPGHLRIATAQLEKSTQAQHGSSQPPTQLTPSPLPLAVADECRPLDLDSSPTSEQEEVALQAWTTSWQLTTRNNLARASEGTLTHIGTPQERSKEKKGHARGDPYLTSFLKMSPPLHAVPLEGAFNPQLPDKPLQYSTTWSASSRVQHQSAQHTPLLPTSTFVITTACKSLKLFSKKKHFCFFQTRMS